MGVPKRRVSHARQGERRAHLAISVPTLEECPHCHEMKLPHHVCPNCGYYQGRLAVQLKPAAPPTTPRADAVTAAPTPEPAPRDGRRASASRSTRWAAITARPRSCPAPSITPGRIPRTRSSWSATRPSIRAHRRRPARRTCRSSMASQVVGMDEHPALALREKKDSSILVAVDLVKRGEADAVVTAGHTGAGMAAAVLRLGRLPGVDRPALAVQMITDAGPIVLLDIGANPDSTAENLVQYAQMGAIFAERVLGVTRAARRAAVDRRGEGQGRRPDPARDRAARRDGPATSGQRRGQGPDPAPGRRRRLRRGPRQRRDQVLRGPVDLHLRPVARRVRAVAARPAGVPAACARASAASGPSSTTRRSADRRCWASAGRSSSPTAGPGGGWSTFACEVAATTARTARPGADRRVARAGPGVAAARSARSPRRRRERAAG